MAVMANLIYGPLFGLFLASSLLPLAFVLIVEKGPLVPMRMPQSASRRHQGVWHEGVRCLRCT